MARLRHIFQGTKRADDFYKTLEKSKSGKEVMQLLANGFTEQKEQLETKLDKKGFKIEEWKEFAEKNKKESKEILSKLNDSGT